MISIPTLAPMTSPAAVDPHARLRELGLELPAPPAAVASYVPATIAPLGAGRVLVSIAGQIGMRDGSPVRRGRVPDQVSIADAQSDARLCALNLLAQLERAVGLTTVERLLQVNVYVRCADDFGEQPAVANGASDLLVDVLGDAGRHARAAVGVNALPFGVPVEVSAVAVARPLAASD